MGLTPKSSSRKKNIENGILMLIPALLMAFMICWGIFNIIVGIAHLPGALFYLVFLGIIDACIFIPALLIIQPPVILYDDRLRLGYIPFSRTIIAFKDIDRFLNIQDKQCRTYFGFILKDGYRFTIPTSSLDDEFIKEFTKRMVSNGLGPGEPFEIERIERFVNNKAYEIQEIEQELLKQARARKGE